MNRQPRDVAQELLRYVDDEHRVVAVSGESGAGKTTIARELAAAIGARLVHMDDYFHAAPADNHRRRVEDLGRVGPGEVDLDRLAAEVAAAPGRVVVEGTWVMHLEADLHVFLERTFEDTRPDREARARDPLDEWIPRILAIEHELVASWAERADLRVDRSWRVHPR